MKLEDLNGKSLAECKGIVITKKLYYSKENNYPYVRIKEKDSDKESQLVMLSPNDPHLTLSATNLAL